MIAKRDGLMRCVPCGRVCWAWSAWPKGGRGPTYGQVKRMTPEQREDASLALLVEKELRGMPVAFINTVREEWARVRDDVGAQQSARWGFGLVRSLRRAERVGVAHGDGDADLCRKAEREARLMTGMLDAVGVATTRKLQALRCIVDDFGQLVVSWMGRCVPMLTKDWMGPEVEREKVREAAQDFERRGIADRFPSGPAISLKGVLSRLKDPIFWRRVLRRVHATMLESAAIGLGLVRKGRGCYVSDESLKRRRAQKARNAAVMKATVALNERGEDMTLADCVARSTGNQGIRRMELMTRIAGFEVLADAAGHDAKLITATCPSRMHKWVRGDDRLSKPNPKYDGTLPGEAQAYMGGQWAKLRAAADRRGLRLYGFRIAEPHHDGCPHWHLLLWHAPTTERGHDAGAVLKDLFRRYFLLNDNPDEPGAARYRVDIKPIDRSKGNAAGYVAKYIAKNVDGYAIEEDMFGNPALVASERVEAWARTHSIRQFQQIGGAPVGVWRELRRVHPGAAPEDADQALHDALMMVNVSAIDALMGGGESVSVVHEQQRVKRGWAAYIEAQGGPLARRRDHRLRVLRESTGEVNRYGDIAAPAVVGVQTCARQEQIYFGAVRIRRLRADHVESERCAWTTATYNPNDAKSRRRVVERLQATMDARQAQVDQARGAAVRPWTRVNNCTGAGESIAAMYAPHVVRVPKTGRVFRWKDQQVKREGLHHGESGGYLPPDARVSCHPQGSRAHAHPAVESLSHERHPTTHPARTV